LEHIVFTVFVIIFVHEWYQRGLLGVADILMRILKRIPGVGELIQQLLSGEVQSFTRQIKSQSSTGVSPVVDIPEHGSIVHSPKSAACNDRMLQG
jgi:type II secretory pathway component PulF